MSDEFDHDYDPYDGEDTDCWNCGGEGYVFDCIDGFCLDAEIGCDLCTRRCDVCNRRPTEAPATAAASLPDNEETE